MVSSLEARPHASSWWPSTSAIVLVIVAVIASQSTRCHAQDSNASSQSIMKVTEIEGISEYKLDNGVRVLLFPDESKEVVTVNMTVFVGSRHEGYGEAGMAHLLEHMLFKGTPEHPDVPKVLNDRGARFNGTTWVDRTNYYETLPATDENLQFALELESDRLVNSYIKGEDLVSEMTVVRNEFESGENSPFRVLMQRMQSAAYEWHNYGQSTIGNKSDIERVPIVNLRKFYRKYYRPDNVMVIVAGKFKTETALQKIQATFGKLTPPETPIDPTYTVEPPQDGERTVVLRRVGDVQLVGATYHIPPASHPEFASAKVLAHVLQNEPSGRLYQQMVEPKIASNVSAIAFAFAEPGVLMTFAMIPQDQSLEQARVKLIEVIEESFYENPVTKEELERARQDLLKRRELEAAETDRLAVSLSEWAAQGDWRLYFLFRDTLEELTADDVQEVAQKYFRRNNRTVGLFIPTEAAERVSIPEPPNLADKLDGYKGRAVVQAGEQFDPDPLAIEQRTERGNLTDGIKYALLPKVTRGGTVSMNLVLRYGTAESLHGRLGPVELMGMLMTRGTEKLDYQQIRDELTRLRAEISFNSTLGTLQVSVKTKREFLPEVIDLLGDMLKRPRLDPSDLEIIRNQITTSLEQELSEPTAKGPRWVRRKLSPYEKGDIRYVPTAEEEIEIYKSVRVEEIKELHSDFLSGEHGELSMVGDFDPAEVKKQLSEQLSGWVSKQPFERAGRPANEDVSGVYHSIETPDKANAMLFASRQIELSDSSTEYAALVLGNYILGGGSLTSRLANRVRQQEGLSYTIRSAVSAQPKDNRVDWILYAITNPANMGKLVDVIKDEIDNLRKDGVTEEELEQAKGAYLQAARVRRTGDAELSGQLLGTLFNERTMKFRKEYEDRIRNASVEEVNAAIKKFISHEKLVKAAAGDFASVKQ